jgi:quercetin 2,3-dioxygenase
MSSRPLPRRPLLLTAGLLPLGALGVLEGCRGPSGDGDADARANADTRVKGPEVREVERLVRAEATVDGAGVKLRRSLGSRALPMLDPFLMLDEFATDRPEDYLAGFPDHPHRGFETVTYMIHGAMEHRDSLGNRGRLGPGSVQWMTAGRGIIHSEMPKQQDGLMWGFQLWVNLPAAQKLTTPRYQDIAPERVAEVGVGGNAVRVVAGEAGGARGPVEGVASAPLLLDVKVPARGRFRHELPAAHGAFAYVFEGGVSFGGRRTRVERGQLAAFGPGALVQALGDDGGRFLLLAGRPWHEPVARSGPFVMNTDAEIRQAIADYRSGRLVKG